MGYWIRILALILVVSAGSDTAGRDTQTTNIDVRLLGAVGDARTKDTRALQAAIDTCARDGGGTVYFPPGVYLSGSLHLKSRVSLHLDHGATLLASKDEADFDPYETLDFKNDADRETSFFHYALIWGEDLKHIAITGTGIIDGNREKRGGPKPIALKRCRQVVIRDLTLVNAPNYNISLLGCDDVNIDGVTIRNGFSDGIDPDCCRNVRIANCHIESWDDAIVPKASFSLGVRRACENIVVSNCVLATNRNAFKLGTESGGDFKNIAVSNCVMIQRPSTPPPLAGVALVTVDGSHLSNVTISNIAMTNVRVPIFLRLGNRGRDNAPAPGTLKNVVLSNIVAKGADSPSAIVGIPGHPIENVTLRDIHVSVKGAGTIAQTQAEVPEEISKYPDAHMFGTLPAYGLYARHVTGLKLFNVGVECESPDLRHAIVCEDAQGLTIDSLDAAQSQGGESVLRFDQVSGALVRSCAPRCDLFLRVLGKDSRGIRLIGNDFTNTRAVVKRGPGVGKGRVTVGAMVE